MRLDRSPLLLCLLGAMALAQYPPGQYPPGQYPPGQGQCPAGQVPPCTNRRKPTNGTPMPGGRSSSKKDKNKTENAVLTTTIGIARRVAPSQIVMEAIDHRIVWFRVTQATKFMKNNKEVDAAAFTPGDHITMD